VPRTSDAPSRFSSDPDIASGTGIPTADNTHEVAQSIAPDSRVLYVDNDHCKSGCAPAHGGGQDS
jgi:hypothetical protein